MLNTSALVLFIVPSYRFVFVSFEIFVSFVIRNRTAR